MFGAQIPVTPKKNTKAFGSSGATTSSEWFDSKVPNCVDFDKPSMFYICPALISKIKSLTSYSPYLRRFQKGFPFQSRRLRWHAVSSSVQKIWQDFRSSG
jgi:hypothetical protein